MEITCIEAWSKGYKCSIMLHGNRTKTLTWWKLLKIQLNHLLDQTLSNPKFYYRKFALLSNNDLKSRRFIGYQANTSTHLDLTHLCIFTESKKTGNTIGNFISTWQITLNRIQRNAFYDLLWSVTDFKYLCLSQPMAMLATG